MAAEILLVPVVVADPFRLYIVEREIKRQLSHMERNGVRAAYTHHAQYLEERTAMMQQWADYLDKLREQGTLVKLSALGVR